MYLQNINDNELFKNIILILTTSGNRGRGIAGIQHDLKNNLIRCIKENKFFVEKYPFALENVNIIYSFCNQLGVLLTILNCKDFLESFFDICGAAGKTLLTCQNKNRELMKLFCNPNVAKDFCYVSGWLENNELLFEDLRLELCDLFNAVTVSQLPAEYNTEYTNFLLVNRIRN